MIKKSSSHTRLLIIIILLLIILGLSYYLGCKTASDKIQNLGPYFLPKEGIVVKVLDGDTIEIAPPNQISPIAQPLDRISSRSVRYLGIDAPNQGDEKFKEAKVANERLVLGKKVTLEYDTPQNDKYGRILAWVWFDGKLINKEMLVNGLAKPFLMEGQKLKYDLLKP